MSTDRYLTIYLRDHLAATTVGLEFVERVIAENRDNAIGEHLTPMGAELQQEAQALRQAMELLQVEPSHLKIAGAWLAEKTGRLKFNGRLRGYSPLSRLLEIEFLMAALQARKGLWMTLQDARHLYPQLEQFPMERYADRADEQLARLEKMHLKAARAMLKAAQKRDIEGQQRPPVP